MTKSCQCMHEVWESGTFSAQLEELYGAQVSAGMISEVTDSVLEEVKAWQNRPLAEVYPTIYLDAL